MANTTKPIIDANALEAMAKERPDEKFLKGSGVLKLIQAIRDLERANRQLQAEQPTQIKDLRKALQFYADGHHFIKSDGDAWDTVSGEPQNYWCDEAGTATVEDGSIAKLALAGHPIKFEDEGAPAQPAAPQGVAYADAHGAIMGAAYDFRDAHISGSPNQKRSAHAALESAVTHALRASNGQAPATQQTLERNAVPAEWLEQAYREGWAACRDAETIGGESEDWSFGNSTANSRMIDAQQAVHQPAPTAQATPVEWDGKLPTSLQRCLNALRLECPPAVVNGVEHEVRSTFEALHTTLATTKRMYGAARDRLGAVEAAQAAPALAENGHLTQAGHDLLMEATLAGATLVSKGRLVGDMAQAESQPAPVLGYPPLPHELTRTDRGHLIQRFRVEELMRAYVDADRAARKQGGV